MRKFGLTILCCFLCVCVASAQSKQRQEIERLRKEISELDKQIKANEGKSADATAQLALTKKKVAASRKLVSESEKESRRSMKPMKGKPSIWARTFFSRPRILKRGTP